MRNDLPALEHRGNAAHFAPACAATMQQGRSHTHAAPLAVDTNFELPFPIVLAGLAPTTVDRCDFNLEGTPVADHSSTCSKCNSKSEPGFLLDRGHMQQPFVANWVEGPPLPPQTLTNMFRDRLQNKRQVPVTVYRCTSCGFLEFYAADATNPI